MCSTVFPNHNGICSRHRLIVQLVALQIIHIIEELNLDLHVIHAPCVGSIRTVQLAEVVLHTGVYELDPFFVDCCLCTGKCSCIHHIQRLSSLCFYIAGRFICTIAIAVVQRRKCILRSETCEAGSFFNPILCIRIRYGNHYRTARGDFDLFRDPVAVLLMQFHLYRHLYITYILAVSVIPALLNIDLVVSLGVCDRKGSILTGYS